MNVGSKFAKYDDLFSLNGTKQIGHPLINMHVSTKLTWGDVRALKTSSTPPLISLKCLLCTKQGEWAVVYIMCSGNNIH